MSSSLVHLPSPPLPEGWRPSSMFTDCVVRHVSNVAGWAPDVIMAQPFVEGAIHLLVVEAEEEGWTGRPFLGVKVGPFPSRGEAIAACERVYCGCYVGRSAPSSLEVDRG